MRRLQEDWKKIGHVPRSQTNKVWDDFRNACNTFFNNFRTKNNAQTDDWKEKLGRKKVNKEDKAKLKKYSVVIASLTNKYNGSEHLKKTLGAREALIVVKNTSGIYYVIIGTYDSEQEALNKIKTVEEQYNARKSSAQLLKTYRIPLTDLWILRK